MNGNSSKTGSRPATGRRGLAEDRGVRGKNRVGPGDPSSSRGGSARGCRSDRGSARSGRGSGRVRPEKHVWHDGNGNKLTAGGVLVYDNLGVWAILESWGGQAEWTDIGGKYELGDGDIFATIAREFSEETYHSAALTRSDVLALAGPEGSLSYVTGTSGRPVYASLAVDADRLAALGAEMSPREFEAGRAAILRGNPGITPEDVYTAVELRRLSYTALAAEKFRISSRLRQALECSPVAARIAAAAAELRQSQAVSAGAAAPEANGPHPAEGSAA